MLLAPSAPFQVQAVHVLRAAQRERHTKLTLLPLVIERLPARPAQLDQPLPGWGVGRARPLVEVVQVIVQQVLIERLDATVGDLRSEEHTSELQSRENLVCRLLLEKKK